MLFDAKAALAEIRKQGAAPATLATSATLCVKPPPKVADVADVAALLPDISKSDPRDKVSENVADVAKVAGSDRHFPKTDMRHGFTANGDPKTWTGRIVAIDAWQGLTEWDRHGPNGRLYCGVCRQWVAECAHMVK